MRREKEGEKREIQQVVVKPLLYRIGANVINEY
jgi:hypothetical protein